MSGNKVFLDTNIIIYILATSLFLAIKLETEDIKLKNLLEKLNNDNFIWKKMY